jgi:hypothetical protein
MANVKITKSDGQVIEISDLTFDQVKEIAGLNGHVAQKSVAQRGASLNPNEHGPNYEDFKEAMTEKAKRFFQILRENPNGISADALAEKLGFSSSSQIGGMTGGGIGKVAPRYSIKPKCLYVTEVKRDNGRRTVVYRPGKDILKVL